MRTKESDAIFIQKGACNPTAIANTFIKHCKNMDTNQIRTDPAMRLIIHQLSFLMDINGVDNNYSELIANCEDK